MTLLKSQIKSRLRTNSQNLREERNVKMVKRFELLKSKNPEEKKTTIIGKIATEFKLTYSTTRLILIKAGAYRSKI